MLASIRLLNSDLHTYPPWRLNSSMEHKAEVRGGVRHRKRTNHPDSSESQCSYSWFTSSLSCPLVTSVNSAVCLWLLGSKGNSPAAVP